jgi:hypothetical protein
LELMETEKSFIREMIRELHPLQVVHDWSIKAPPQLSSTISFSPEKSSPVVNIQVKELTTKSLHTICIDKSLAIIDLKQRLFKLTRIPPEEQRLIVDGKVLKNDQKIECIIQSSSNPTVFLTHMSSHRTTTNAERDVVTEAGLTNSLGRACDVNRDSDNLFFEDFSEFLIAKHGKDRGNHLVESYRKDFEQLKRKTNK